MPRRPELVCLVLDHGGGSDANREVGTISTCYWNPQSVSERGDLLLSSFFLQPRYDLAPNTYMLDLARPGRSKIIRNFQEALKAKAILSVTSF